MQLITQTVKFIALTGVSMLSISDILIDLGTTKKLGLTHTGSFTVTNLSGQLPLLFQLTSTNANMKLVDYTLNDNDLSTEILVESVSQLSFAINCNAWGLFREFFILRNINNPLQVAAIEIRLFADIQILSLKNIPKIEDTLTVSSNPLLEWTDIYVCENRVSDSKPFFSVQRNLRSDSNDWYEKKFDLENSSDELVEVAVFSDIPLSVRWVFPNASEGGFVMDSLANYEPSSKWKQCGPVLLIRSKQIVTGIYFYFYYYINLILL